MATNCNLELRLLTPSFDDHTLGEDACQRQPMIEQATQKLTIFYNGTVSSCDVTEIQARSIISVASEEKVRKEKEAMTAPAASCSETSSDSCPKAQVMMYKQNTGLSMKRSLQQFLQKRRTKARPTLPYNCTP